MGLEDEIRESMDASAAALGIDMEMLADEEREVEMDIDEAISLLLTRQVALEDAVLKLARRLDGS